jgi:hypothetical protein
MLPMAPHFALIPPLPAAGSLSPPESPGSAMHPGEAWSPRSRMAAAGPSVPSPRSVLPHQPQPPGQRAAIDLSPFSQDQTLQAASGPGASVVSPRHGPVSTVPNMQRRNSVVTPAVPSRPLVGQPQGLVLAISPRLDTRVASPPPLQGVSRQQPRPQSPPAPAIVPPQAQLVHQHSAPLRPSLEHQHLHAQLHHQLSSPGQLPRQPNKVPANLAWQRQEFSASTKPLLSDSLDRTSDASNQATQSLFKSQKTAPLQRPVVQHRHSKSEPPRRFAVPTSASALGRSRTSTDGAPSISSSSSSVGAPPTLASNAAMSTAPALLRSPFAASDAPAAFERLLRTQVRDELVNGDRRFLEHMLFSHPYFVSSYRFLGILADEFNAILMQQPTPGDRSLESSTKLSLLRWASPLIDVFVLSDHPVHIAGLSTLCTSSWLAASGA